MSKRIFPAGRPPGIRNPLQGTVPTSADPADKEGYKTFRRVEALRAVMQKVLRAMSLTGLRLALVDPRTPALFGVPGWTNGEDVAVNRTLIRDMLYGVTYDDPRFSETVAAFHGVCYHELGHILFSPRTDSFLVQRVKDLAQNTHKSFWWAYNGLEDQRMENMFTGRYEPTTPYFNQVVSEWLVKTPEALVMAHTLCWGRRYLPDSIRLMARQVFEVAFSRDLAVRFAQVIDEYCDIVFDGSTNADIKALDCVRRYRELLMETKRNLPPMPVMDNTPDDPNAADDDSENAVSKGKPDKDKQEDAQDKAKERDKERQDERDNPPPADTEGMGDEDEKDGGDEEDDDGNPEAGDQDGEGEDDEEGEGDDAGQGDQEGDAPDGEEAGQSEGDDDGTSAGDDGDTDSDSDSDSDGSKDSGKKTKPGQGADQTPLDNPTASPDDLFDNAQDVLEDVKADEGVQTEVADTINAIQDTIENDDGLGGMEAPFEDDVPISEAKTIVSQIVAALQPLRLEQEPHKIRRQTAGRLNMRRFMEADDDEMDLFDQWDTEQEEAGGVDVVVLLDLSGSMLDRMSLISQMMWAIKTSFDQMEVRCTVLGFATDWCVLYRPTEKASGSSVRLYSPLGGTLPYYAIREAHRLLMESDLPNRIMVSITDGEWFSAAGGVFGTTNSAVVDAEIQPFMEDLHARGTTTMLIGIYDADAPMFRQNLPVAEHGKHLHELAFDTYDLPGIPITISELVVKVLAKAAAGHSR